MTIAKLHFTIRSYLSQERIERETYNEAITLLLPILKDMKTTLLSLCSHSLPRIICLIMLLNLWNKALGMTLMLM